MSPAAKNQAAPLLVTCQTLADADHLLMKVRPLPSRALRCGLFDGFAGRPRTTAGLAIDPPPKEVVMDYQEGCEIGRELSLRNVPG